MRSGQGETRTILLLQIISVRPSKQPLMVRTFLKVYMELGSYFLFLQEQIKDIIIIVVLKDDSKSVVLRVEALVAPVGVDRSSRGRKNTTRASGGDGGVRVGGRTRARRPRCLATCVTAVRALVVVAN
jgi:hypothetical protein